MTCCEYKRQKKMEKLMPNWPHPDTHQEAIKDEGRTEQLSKETKEKPK
jgi:predicted GIY-YIG superfamily endonuclease